MRWRRSARCPSGATTAASTRRPLPVPRGRLPSENGGPRTRRGALAAAPRRARLDRTLRRRRRRRLRRVLADERARARNQGWKDSDDSVFDESGMLVGGCHDRPGRGAGLRLRREGRDGAPRRGAGSERDLAQRLESDAKRCGGDSRTPSGAPISASTRSRWTARSACRVRTSNSGRCLLTGLVGEGPGAPGRGVDARAGSLLGLGHPHRELRASAASIRSRTTTARSGRTTTL